jgi:hypothetical protein
LRNGFVEPGGERDSSVAPDGRVVNLKLARCFGMFQFLRPVHIIRLEFVVTSCRQRIERPHISKNMKKKRRLRENKKV